MKIRLLVSRSSAHTYYKTGQVVDWPEESARRLIEVGQAEAVAVVETAAEAPSPPREQDDAPQHVKAKRTAKRRTHNAG